MTDDMEKITELLMWHFEGDTVKVAGWLRTGNMMLGDVRPLDMVRAGKSGKLIATIERWLDITPT